MLPGRVTYARFSVPESDPSWGPLSHICGSLKLPSPPPHPTPPSLPNRLHAFSSPGLPAHGYPQNSRNSLGCQTRWLSVCHLLVEMKAAHTTSRTAGNQINTEVVYSQEVLGSGYPQFTASGWKLDLRRTLGGTDGETQRVQPLSSPNPGSCLSHSPCPLVRQWGESQVNGEHEGRSFSLPLHLPPLPPHWGHSLIPEHSWGSLISQATWAQAGLFQTEGARAVDQVPTLPLHPYPFSGPLPQPFPFLRSFYHRHTPTTTHTHPLSEHFLIGSRVLFSLSNPCLLHMGFFSVSPTHTFPHLLQEARGQQPVLWCQAAIAHLLSVASLPPQAPCTTLSISPAGLWGAGLACLVTVLPCIQPLKSVGDGLGAGDPMARLCPWPWLLKGWETPHRAPSLGLAFSQKHSVLPCLSIFPA